MTPEELIGPAAAKALAEHYDLTPKAKPLPDVVTMEEIEAYVEERSAQENDAQEKPRMGWEYFGPAHKRRLKSSMEAFVLCWLRARLEVVPTPDWRPADDGYGVTRNDATRATSLHRADTFHALTGRPW